MTDAETIAELQRENAELKTKLSGEKVGTRLWRGVAYVWREHKTDIVNAAIALGAIVYAASKPATVEKHTETVVREVPASAGKQKADTIEEQHK